MTLAPSSKEEVIQRDGLKTCIFCGKPTRSHAIEKHFFICHTCWQKDEVQEKVKEIKEHIAEHKKKVTLEIVREMLHIDRRE